MTLAPGASVDVGGMMCGGSFPEPEVNQNLGALNHFGFRGQAYMVAFLKTGTEGYFQR